MVRKPAGPVLQSSGAGGTKADFLHILLRGQVGVLSWAFRGQGEREAEIVEILLCYDVWEEVKMSLDTAVGLLVLGRGKAQ